MTGASYYRLNLDAAIDALLPADEYGSAPTEAHRLGTLADSTQLAGLIGTLDDTDYFSLTAGVSGTVTFSAATTHALAAAWTVEGGSVGGDDGETISLDVVSGETYVVGLSTRDGIGHYELSVSIEPSERVVHVDGQTVHVRGTDADDSVELVLGETHKLTVNGVTYSFSAADIAAFEIETGGGTDRIELTGTAGDESAELHVGQLRFTSRTVHVAADSVETIIVTGGGGQDTAKFYDSAGDDLYQSWKHAAVFGGDGFNNRALGFHQTHAYATAGGYDRARLFDSAGDDLYQTRATDASMSGHGFRNTASHFERARGIATAGGYDEARMYDSADDNLYQAWSTHVTMHGPGFFNIAEKFERTRAFATAGGYDEARIFDTPADDIYVAHPTHASLSGKGFFNIVEGFERTRGIARAGGYDEARIYDTPGDDIYVATPKQASLSGHGFFNSAEGFERTRGLATAGGYDEARLYDGPGRDIYYTWPTHVTMSGAGFLNTAEKFEYTRGFATAGGDDEVRMYDSIHDDLFQTWDGRAAMSGAGYLNVAEGFGYQRGWSSAGNDEARFYDSTDDDYVIARVWGAYLEGGTSRSQATDFATIRVFGESGGENTSDLEIVDFLFQLVGEWV